MKKINIRNILKLSLSGLLIITTILTGCSKKTDEATTDTSSSEVYDSSKPYPGKFENGKLTEPFHLKIPTPTGFTEGLVADAKGFYEEVGIIPEYTGVLPANVSLAQSVIKGDNDLFGSGHVTTIAAVRAAGAKIKVVLTGSVDSSEFDKTHMTWFVKEGSNIKSAKDLIGKKIAMSSKGSCAELWNAEFLRQNGVDVSKTEIVVMSDQQQEQALKQGNIDLAILHAPYNMKAKNNGGLEILTTSYDIAKGAGDGQLSGVGCRAFSEDFIEKYPDVVKAYIVATVKAQQYVNNNYEESLKAAADILKIDVKDTSGSLYAKDQKWVIPEQIDFWIKLSEKNKFTGFETPGKVKAEDLYTNDLNPYKSGEVKYTSK